jgi:hypothetical protein
VSELSETEDGVFEAVIETVDEDKNLSTRSVP